MPDWIMDITEIKITNIEDWPIIKMVEHTDNPLVISFLIDSEAFEKAINKLKELQWQAAKH
jgi:hypothetical protein